MEIKSTNSIIGLFCAVLLAGCQVPWQKQETVQTPQPVEEIMVETGGEVVGGMEREKLPTGIDKVAFNQKPKISSGALTLINRESGLFFHFDEIWKEKEKGLSVDNLSNQQIMELFNFLKKYEASSYISIRGFNGKIKTANIDITNQLSVKYFLKYIVSLSITHQNLVEIPPELCYLSNLRELDLSYNNLTKLPAEIKNLEHLNFLNLSHNAFSDYPQNIDKIPNLRVFNLLDTPYANQFRNKQDNLSLHSNKIEKNQEQNLNIDNLNDQQVFNLFAFLKEHQASTYVGLNGFFGKVEILSINSNDLIGIRQFLKQILALSITHQNLAEIPPELCYLSNLRELDLSYNNLTKLPTEIKNLAALQFLNLSHNTFTDYPQEINKIPNLKVYNLLETPYDTCLRGACFTLPSIESGV